MAGRDGRFGPDAAEAEILDAVTARQIASAFAAYRAGMEAALETTLGPRLLLDKNPSYFPLIAPLARLFPGAPLLVALRDPRAVVWSCFTQALPLNPESAPFLDLANTVEHIRVWLGRWLRLRPRLSAPWREVRYESMVSAPRAEAEETLRFLGLPWDDRVLSFHEAKTPVRSPSYASASRPVNAEALEKWRPYAEFLEPHLGPLKPVMAELGYLP
jgi:hypothetical protein